MNPIDDGTFKSYREINEEENDLPNFIPNSLSFQFKVDQESHLITGDIVLGSPSSVVEDLDVYLSSLRRI